MKDRIILHCDANSFYASVESVYHREYNNLPLAVTGAPEKRTGIILAKNEHAKKMGVKTGEPIYAAKQKCPNLICVAPNMKLYEEFSLKLHEIYYQYTDKIEPFGIDECWLDITDSINYLKKSGQQVADEIRLKVKELLGITISVGVSFGKLFAKLGSDMKKPDATTMITRENFVKKVYNLPINQIIGIGKKMELRFHKFNVKKLGDIVATDDKILKTKFGIVGIRLKDALKGNDSKVNNEFFEVKSVGNGTTTIHDILSRKEISSVVLYLADEVSTRMRDKKLFSRCINVSIKDKDFNYYDHSIHLNYSTNIAQDLIDESMRLIDSFWKYDKYVRAIRISCSNLCHSFYEQTNLFQGYKIMQKTNLSCAIDEIRKKYGSYSITYASLNKNAYINFH